MAVIGASADRSKFGNKAVRAYLGKGYTVWPVNPKGGEIEGLPVFRGLEDLPELPHRATIYLPSRPAIAALEQLADMEKEHGRRVSAVYLNPGADPPEVVARATDLGLKVHTACSIRAIGEDPADY